MPDVPVSQAAPQQRHLQAAADWFLQLSEDDTPASRHQWQLWHDAAPAHQQAWERVERLQSLLAGAPLQAAKVFGQIPDNSSSSSGGQGGAHSRRQLLAFAGVAIAAGLGWALLPFGRRAAPTEWVATAPGERRALTLPDGGSVWLGSATRIGIAYGSSRRDIYLDHGAMQMTSGSDAQGRPLRILARDGALRPLGTRLSISQYGERSVLAVQEHAVEVQPLSGPVVRVDAGQRLVFNRHGAGRPQATAVADDAWTRGQVMAMNTPLSEFAEQFSLYSGRALEVAPSLARRRVSGTYQIDAAERSLGTLAEVLGIRVEKTAGGWRLSPL